MRALEYWKAVTADKSAFLDRFLTVLARSGARYCVIGGQGVNAFAEPVVSLDLDLVVATEDMGPLEGVLSSEFRVERFPHSIDVSAPGSDLRIQLQTDPRYTPFVSGATPREVLGVRLPVARVEDVLQGKIWAVQDPARHASKRQKDLADIARLLEAHPGLRSRVPGEILSRLI